jgi:hypothetical protein
MNPPPDESAELFRPRSLIEAPACAGITRIAVLPDVLPPGALTMSVVVPEIDPDAAVIVVEPAATPVARPVALIVATPVLDEVQVAVDVKSCVLLSP